MSDVYLFKISIDNYPKTKEWMKACENAPGMREVQKDFMENMVPKMQAMMN